MQTVKMRTTCIGELPKKCVVFENRRCKIIMDDYNPVLPKVPIEYEGILRNNKIPYSIVEDQCKFWNPSTYEETEVTLPFYAFMQGEYRYVKEYTVKIPTKDSISMANKTRGFVNEEIRKYKAILKEVGRYRNLKETLNGGVIKIVSDFRITAEAINGNEDIEMNKDHFKVLVCYYASGFNTGYSVVVDMNKVAKEGYLYLIVPKGILGLVIGKGGENARRWEKILGVKKIKIIPED